MRAANLRSALSQNAAFSGFMRKKKPLGPAPKTINPLSYTSTVDRKPVIVHKVHLIGVPTCASQLLSLPQLLLLFPVLLLTLAAWPQ